MRINIFRDNISQPEVISATEKNFNASPISKNAKKTFTVFSHPPERGIEFNHDGKRAKRLNGTDNAIAKPSIPTAGAIIEPEVDTCTKRVPIIGPVQEKDTITRVNAIKEILTSPVVCSALSFNAVDHDAGNVISKKPKNEIAKKTSNPKNTKLNTAFVDSLLSALAPNINVISIPKSK
jgi:hypothetical protein